MGRRSRRKKGEGNIRFDSRYNRWVASFKPANGPRRYVTGRKGELWSQFKARLDVARKEAANRLPVTPTTLGEYVSSVWLPKLRREVEPRTCESYLATAQTYLIPLLGRVRLADIRPEDIERCMAAAIEKGRSLRTVNYIRGVARIVLNAAMKSRIIDRNAAALTDPARLRGSASRFTVDPYTEAEVRALTDAAQQTFNGLFVTLAAYLGLRRGEALGLKWQDYDTSKATIFVSRQVVREEGEIRVKHLKTLGSKRSLRLPAFLVQQLNDHRKAQLEQRLKAGDQWKNEDFIFSSRLGGPLDPRNAVRLYEGIVKRARLRRRRFHDLRHTTASLQLQRGTLDITVSKMLGHSSTRITKDVYAHVTPPMMDFAVCVMDDIYTARENDSTSGRRARDGAQIRRTDEL